MKILKPEEVFDKVAKIYESKFMDVSIFADTFNTFCNQIDADDARILDIACGPGNISRYLLDRKPEYNILGIDLSARMLDLARANSPEAKFQLMDCREINTIRQTFAGIVCGFCLPYLTPVEAVQLIANVAGLLVPSGVFYLSTMEENADNKSRVQTSGTGDRVYVHYHREDYLVKALTESGFELILTKRFYSVDRDGLNIIDLVLIGRWKPGPPYIDRSLQT